MGALLGAIGLTPFSSQNLAGREHTLVKALRTSGVRMIVIDELHNMLSAHGRQQHQLLNLPHFDRLLQVTLRNDSVSRNYGLKAAIR